MLFFKSLYYYIDDTEGNSNDAFTGDELFSTFHSRIYGISLNSMNFDDQNFCKIYVFFIPSYRLIVKRKEKDLELNSCKLTNDFDVLKNFPYYDVVNFKYIIYCNTCFFRSKHLL